jgi:hypothetical protein
VQFQEGKVIERLVQLARGDKVVGLRQHHLFEKVDLLDGNPGNFLLLLRIHLVYQELVSRFMHFGNPPLWKRYRQDLDDVAVERLGAGNSIKRLALEDSPAVLGK